MSDFVQLPCGAEVLVQTSIKNMDTHNPHPEHCCDKCGSKIPIFCSEYDEKEDKHRCYRCSKVFHLNFTSDMESDSLSFSSSSSSSSTNSVISPPKSIVFPTYEPSDNLSEIEADQLELKPTEEPIEDPGVKSPLPTAVKRCKTCGGTDHVRTSSLKCPFNKRRLQGCIPAPPPSNNKTVGVPVDTQAPTKDPPSIHHVMATTTTKAKSTDSNINTATKEDDSKCKEMWKPNFKNIATTAQKYNPVVDVTSDKFKPIDTVFTVPVKNYRGRSTTLEPSPLNLV